VVLPHSELEIVGHTQQSETVTDRRMRQLRDVRVVGGLGMSMGGIIGGVIGGPAAPVTAPIGAAIGALVAGGFGYRNAGKSMRLRDRTARSNSIRSELIPVQGIHRAEAERAIEAAIGSQRPFQVYQGAGADKLQVRPGPGLIQQIKMDQPLFFAGLDLHRGQTAPIHGHAPPDFQAGAGFCGFDDQPNSFRSGPDRRNNPRLFNDSREHAVASFRGDQRFSRLSV
jgi:hypothetical protein